MRPTPRVVQNERLPGFERKMAKEGTKPETIHPVLLWSQARGY